LWDLLVWGLAVVLFGLIVLIGPPVETFPGPPDMEPVIIALDNPMRVDRAAL
jgi:hypothetical protein